MGYPTIIGLCIGCSTKDVLIGPGGLCEVCLVDKRAEHDLRTKALAIAALKDGYIPVPIGTTAPFHYYCGKLGPHGMRDGKIVNSQLYDTPLEALAATAETLGLEPDPDIMCLDEGVAYWVERAENLLEENNQLKIRVTNLAEQVGNLSEEAFSLREKVRNAANRPIL